MEEIIAILTNLFSGVELGSIMDTVAGFLTEYDISAVVDTVSDFFGGMLG